MGELQFILYSPEGDEVVCKTSKVVFRNSEGEVCILPDHARYFTRVVEGRIELEDTTILTKKGYLVVKDNTVIVLVERAQDLSKVVPDELQEEIKELSSIPSERMSSLQSDKLDWLKKIQKELKEKEEV